LFSVGLLVNYIVLSSREIVLDFVVFTLLIVLLLAILIRGLPNEFPLRSLIELWLLKTPVWFQNTHFFRVCLSI
jgi:hypothetical protein